MFAKMLPMCKRILSPDSHLTLKSLRLPTFESKLTSACLPTLKAVEP